MPRTQGEDDKKHGDKLDSLIERTGGNPSSRKRTESADEDAPLLVPDDEDDAAVGQDDEDDPVLEDDDDEDVQNDDFETHRDVDEPE